MRKTPTLSIAAALVVGAMTLAGCQGSSNLISGAFGGKAFVRLIDASTTSQTLQLKVASTSIETGINSTTPIGTYQQVGAGIQTVEIADATSGTDVMPSFNPNFAASTNNTVVLAGEPAAFANYTFQDTNASAQPGTARFKVDDAAPNTTTGALDVYVYPNLTTRPGTPTVAAIRLGQDSGSKSSPEGDAYIPKLAASGTQYPTGSYRIDVFAAGSTASLLATKIVSVTTNATYSIVIEDVNGTANNIKLIVGIDQPYQGSNQSSLSASRTGL